MAVYDGLHDIAKVIVHLTDVNDNPPVFDKDVYKTKVREDAKVGTYLLQVRGSITKNSLKDINRIFFKIYSYHRHRLYTFVFISPRLYNNTQIELRSQLMMLIVVETLKFDTLLYQVGSKNITIFSFEIHFVYNTGNVGKAFRINALTGTLHLNAPIDRESTHLYNLTILARDRGKFFFIIKYRKNSNL